MHSISIVVPVYNEEGNVKELHQEILKVCTEHHYNFEIIFVDDGSEDHTVEECLKLYPLKLVRMRKNFGQTSAMDAGIKLAKYEYIITMDGDRQNDPADIPQMLNYLIENNLDVVSGWRKNRQDNIMKKLISRSANFLRYIIIHDGIHDSGCSLKIYKKECFNGINLYGEQHRFIPAILKIKGFKIGEIVVNHRARITGKTKYDWKRAVKGFVDMISVWFWNKFASRPLHLLGGAGMCFISLGFICAAWSVVIFFSGLEMKRNIFPPLLTIFFVIIGLLLFIFGLMSEILMKTYYGIKIDSPYSVSEIIVNGENKKKKIK